MRPFLTTRRPAQAMLLFAIWLPVILGMLGLVYSVGFVLIERRALQTAADAASTAATWSLLYELESGTLDGAKVYPAVQTYATQEPGAAFSAVYTDASQTALANVGSSGTFPSAARGVQVKVQKNVPIVLDKLLGMSGIVTAATSTAALVPTTTAPPAAPVAPVAVSLAEFQTALGTGATYDLLAPTTLPPGALTPLLDFANSPSSAFAGTPPKDYGYWPAATNSDPTGPSSIFTNLQFWSDGRHAAAMLSVGSGGATLALASSTPLANSVFVDPTLTAQQSDAYRDAFTAGLRDNIQQQVTASGKSYGLVVVPLWDTATPTSVHAAGLGVIRLRVSDVTATSAKGQFVLYPAAAWGMRPTTTPTLDFGARLVRLVG